MEWVLNMMIRVSKITPSQLIRLQAAGYTVALVGSNPQPSPYAQYKYNRPIMPAKVKKYAKEKVFCTFCSKYNCEHIN